MVGKQRSAATFNQREAEASKASDSKHEDNNHDDNNKGAENRKHQQDLLDEAIEESFPASDSPTVSQVD